MSSRTPDLYTSAPPDAGSSGAAARRLLALATLATLVLWWAPYSNVILYPIRLFVTFVHESGHALMAIATGGSVESLTVRSNGSGVTMTLGGIPWLVLSGGYLGSTVFGALLLQVGRISRSANWGR